MAAREHQNSSPSACPESEDADGPAPGAPASNVSPSAPLDDITPPGISKMLDRQRERINPNSGNSSPAAAAGGDTSEVHKSPTCQAKPSPPANDFDPIAEMPPELRRWEGLR